MYIGKRYALSLYSLSFLINVILAELINQLYDYAFDSPFLWLRISET